MQLKDIYKSKLEKDKVKYILDKYVWLHDLINKLDYENTFKFIEEERYNLTNIKRKAIQLQDTNLNKKVIDYLLTYSEINIGTFIAASKAKEIIKEIYNSLYIKKTAKGTDLNNYFITKNLSKSFKNKVVKGFVLIQRKL